MNFEQGTNLGYRNTLGIWKINGKGNRIWDRMESVAGIYKEKLTYLSNLGIEVLIFGGKVFLNEKDFLDSIKLTHKKGV